jgi:hypothetical protein
MPLIEMSKHMEGTYSFNPTLSKIQTIGSYDLNSCVVKSKNITIDILIEMPSEYFTERDYLNYRYFVKRNLFMSNVCHQLMNTKNNYKLNYSFTSNFSSTFKPFLCIKFEGLYFVLMIYS